MIEIKNKTNCCGCEGCVQICPKQCISLHCDSEGFLYPKVSLPNCIDCGLCERVCPVINQGAQSQPLGVFGAVNNNREIRTESSSGGIFTLLAEAIINKGGVVFGAQFNQDWDVVHAHTETVDGLQAFRGSKYVQSRIGDVYKQAKTFLEQGRDVLFSGTPCQVSGLRLYLRKSYDRLLCIDFICHGVPSPMIWRKYMSEVLSDNDGLCFSKITFRDKAEGWARFSLNFVIEKANSEQMVISKPLDKDVYIRGFLGDLYLRPSCHDCPSKSFKSGSDITIADFWGIKKYLPELDDNYGTSLVITNSAAGDKIFSNALCQIKATKREAIQQVAYDSVKQHPNRKEFFEAYHKHSTSRLSDLVTTYTKLSYYQRARRFAIRMMQRIKRRLTKYHDE